MTDNYEFKIFSQEIDEYYPFVDKQYYKYINDLNGGVYQNTSLSLVQFDLGQIFNIQKFTNTVDLFLVIPITMVLYFSVKYRTIVRIFFEEWFYIFTNYNGSI